MSIGRAFCRRATLLAALACASLHAADFDIVALGVEGGLDDGNLSSYLIRARGDERYLALDAGSLLSGIRAGLSRGAFDTSQSAKAGAGAILREGITGYFISHAHLDHVAGLMIAATDDAGPKPIYGFATTLDALDRDYFNWTAWPNFADRGAAPALGRYRLVDERAGQWFVIAGTSMSGCLYPLWHDRVTSSMILLRAGDGYFAYFGDTGPDALAQGHRLADVWRVLAPLLRGHQLRGMLIEASYPDDVADTQLFGHLTPAWLLRELQALRQSAGGADALRGLPVLIGHIKPSLIEGRDTRALVEAQLDAGNALGVRFFFPSQGERYRLDEHGAVQPGH